MEFKEYLKALETNKGNFKDNYNYLYGELGVYDNYLIALAAPFLDVVDFFRNSSKWAYKNKRSGSVEERTSPNSRSLTDKLKEIRKDISERVDNQRRRIEMEMRKGIPLGERNDVDLWKKAYEQAEKEYEEGKICTSDSIYFNSLDFHMCSHLIDLPYRQGMPHLGERNPEAFARYNQRVQQRNYRTHLMFHDCSPERESDSQNKERDQQVNLANGIIQICNELIIPNRIPAVFTYSAGSNHSGDFDRVVFYDPK